ncbi:NAD(P)/FAD-dependent oxidoreductase [Emticicia sp. SJ17W-69]|uniref:NAD(P)/FAD-dependent oxidoreductase n=1 Tax=Emticicia sp. SJ17W-69 TaxID=3421657 RepID=UPI003EBA9FB0
MLYDTIIIGGGLGGLTTSIELARKGFKVLVIEKYTYPFHRVCGEYISNEVRPYIESLGINLSQLGAANIDRFQLSSVNGNSIFTNLQMGGFGISRYTIDYELYLIARKLGVTFELNTIVDEIQKINDVFFVDTYLSETFEAKMVIGAYGKRAKLDKILHRKFSNQQTAYIGVKYHIKYDFPKNLIALHNFDGGYCGISAIENDKYCLCYLSERENLRMNGGIPEMEENILFKNPFLKNIFTNAEFLFPKPEVINEISFVKKNATSEHILMVGDTAGLIAPLAGNGMSMAIRAGVLSAELVSKFLKKDISREELEKYYTKVWNQNFQNRIWRGRQLQKLFGNEIYSNLAVAVLSKVPILLRPIIKSTHGKVLKISQTN